jgi:hypothetical protein
MDIWELCLNESSKKTSNPKNTTSILKMRESFKLFSALMQLYFALTDDSLLPSDVNWARKRGFSQPFFCPRQVLINALNAVMEVHFYFKAGSLTESQLVTLQMLIANAQAHMLVLDVVRKRIIEKATTPKDKYVDLSVDKVGLMSNVKFEMLSHMVESMRQCGCDNNARDTEHGEMLMKLCKLLFGDSSGRYHTVLNEMMKKYLHLQYMCIAHKGFEEAKEDTMIASDRKKAHNSTYVISTSEAEEYRSNNSYRKQIIVFKQGAYYTKDDGANWFVHPMLKLVRFP